MFLKLDCRAKKSAWCSLIFTALSVLLVFLIKNIDVAPVGSFGSVVGLSSVNRFFYELFGFNMFWYKITNAPGIAIDVFVALVFFVIGVREWVERKSIFKVDKNLIVLGGIYFVTFLMYVIFEKYAVNYRPIILPGENGLEPSFPSTHTMLALVIVGTAIMESGRLIKNKNMQRIVKTLLYAVICVTVIGRMISGVHWFTDILGGLFIGAALLSFYCVLVGIIEVKNVSCEKAY